jgi:hypothetical protein
VFCADSSFAIVAGAMPWAKAPMTTLLVASWRSKVWECVAHKAVALILELRHLLHFHTFGLDCCTCSPSTARAGGVSYAAMPKCYRPKSSGGRGLTRTTFHHAKILATMCPVTVPRLLRAVARIEVSQASLTVRGRRQLSSV